MQPSEDEFWNKVYKLRYEGKSSSPDYWNLMNDLCCGMYLIFIAWAIYYAHESKTYHAVISVVLVVVFWCRAKRMAKNFIDEIKATWKLI
jgi:hypothetical protein